MNSVGFVVITVNMPLDCLNNRFLKHFLLSLNLAVNLYNHEPDLLKVLWRIWLETELACGKRLKVVIPMWLPFYDKHYGELCEQTRNKLLVMSAATIDRALKPVRDKLTIKKRRQ